MSASRTAAGLLLGLPLLASLLAPLAGAQDADPAPPTAPAGDLAGDPAARALWDDLCRAMLLRAAREAKPITALDLEAGVLERGGDVGSNEVRTRVRWLAPSFVRVTLGSGREVARGPGGDWLAGDGDLVRMQGRDYAEDRAQIEQFLTVVRNFVALSQPEGLDLRNLVLLEDAPAAIPRRHELGRASFRRSLRWIQFETTDLPLAPADDPFAEPTVQQVQIGIDAKTSRPRLALVVDPASGRTPLLFELDDIRPMDDIRVPHAVKLYPLRRTAEGWSVDAEPQLELYVSGGTVRARLDEARFRLPTPEDG